MEQDLKKPLAPLWLRYPSYSRCCLGWRMGGGEDYVTQFGRWFNALSGEEKGEYRRMFPEPKGWLGWYDDEFLDVTDEFFIIDWEKEGQPKYSLSTLMEQPNDNTKTEYLLFWGHQPSCEGNLTKTCLSQWWQSSFRVDAEEYFCMEQYMMAQKALLFKDAEIHAQIMQSKDPKAIKALGRKVKNFHEDVWSQKRYSIVVNGNYAKFIQDPMLKVFLLSTGNKILVEASPYDRIWGIGLAQNDPQAKNPHAWRGQNLLGFALMEVRDELYRVCKNEKVADMLYDDPEEISRKYAKLTALYKRLGIPFKLYQE